MSPFTARLSTPDLDVGTLITLIPTDHPGGPPRPEVPSGAVIAAETSDRKPIELFVRESTTVDRSTREFVVARPDGRLFRVTPQAPSEPGGFWEPGKGMSVWVVRWQVEG